jgi:two-component system, sensor histidine kinase and response regulator
MNDKAKIIIIDDEEVILDSCVQILQGRNYDVYTAPDGMQGLKLVEDIHPDLVYVDLKMPGIPGFEVLERIRNLDQTIVAVVITGYATIDSAVEAMKRGAYDFLPKPFTPDEFRLITKRGIERRALTIETIKLRREKEMLQENFAGIVSHELKSPLSAIQQNLYFLSAELADKLNEKQNEKLERMKIRIDELIKLINSWLRVYSVDLSKIKENFTEIEVPTIINRAIESVEPLANRKDIQIKVTIKEPICHVNGDEISLVEALVNIIGNAVKYSFTGGQVSIDAHGMDSMVEISITDAGVGIPEEELPNVLSDFFRGSTGKTDESSHGIGLTISRRIIEVHDGTITVRSKPSIGTTFFIQIPAFKKEDN